MSYILTYKTPAKFKTSPNGIYYALHPWWKTDQPELILESQLQNSAIK